MSQPTNKTTPHKTSVRVSFAQYGFNSSNQATGPTFSGSNSTSGNYVDSFTGGQNPRWKEQIKAVSDATTAASAARYEFKALRVSGSREYYTADPKGRTPAQLALIHRKGYMSGSTWPQDCDVLPALPLVGSAVTRANNLAIQRLYAQVKGIATSVNAGEDIGELGQTLRMLKGPFKSLTRLTTDVINGHLRAFDYNKSKHIAKALGAVTLEYNFGIRPIISSIAEGFVGLQNRDYIANYYPIKVSGKDKSNVLNPDSTLWSGIWTTKTSVRKTLVTTVRYKGMYGVGADVDRRSVQDVLGWNFRDTLTTVYNLIPYTWLADYVTNTGTIVESLSVPWDGMRWCVKTTRQQAINTGKLLGYVSPAAYPITTDQLNAGTATISATAFMRSSQLTLPVPRPEFSLDVSGRQKGNVLALLASRLPVIGSRLSKAVQKHPTLPREYSVLASRGSMYKIPYPFHRR